jgi:hypothetical protein
MSESHTAERADVARIYRAIGSSRAPMPEQVAVRAEIGRIDLEFARNNLAAVTSWCLAVGAVAKRSNTLRDDPRPGRETAVWHTFTTASVYGGHEGTWMGWRIHLVCYVDGPNPADRLRVSKAVLGTGDEPADEAIVPAGAVHQRRPDDCDDCETNGVNCLAHRTDVVGVAARSGGAA